MTLPLEYFIARGGSGLRGSVWEEIEHVYPGDPIRQIERASIREFMQKHSGLLKGRVLDFGAGNEPYRDLVSGEYVPFEKDPSNFPNFPGGYFDAAICNQVLQYITDPVSTLRWALHASLKPGGHLLLTYATNWDEVEKEDLWRFTKMGMERMLKESGFTILEHELRARVVIGNFKFPLGYGVLCKR